MTKYNERDRNEDSDHVDAAEAVGTVGGGALGAVVGSVLGPVGTVVGGAVGAALGNKMGETDEGNDDETHREE